MLSNNPPLTGTHSDLERHAIPNAFRERAGSVGFYPSS
jgi:hypothetical protein